MDFLNDNIKVKYVADGVRSEFEFAFRAFEKSDVEVYVDNRLMDRGYSVSLDAVAGGTVRFFAAPVSGRVVTVMRRLGYGRVSTFQT
ncbi:MAG: hypothetical protein LBI17_03980, partial [Rickettsiales bacterium]|nr:hypothetical protein [Rickettsiales bacterium]